jgi:hypothetical protein
MLSIIIIIIIIIIINNIMDLKNQSDHFDEVVALN